MRSAKKKIIFPGSCLFHVWLVALSKFPLAVQLIFQKKQMLRALREFVKCRGVLFNLKTLDSTGGKV